MMIVDDWTFEEMRVLGQAIAEDPETAEYTLMELAMHYDPLVRKAVAEHKNTPTDTLHMLAQDENADLRYVLAENHNLPLSVLAILVDDENPFVANRAQKTLNRITVRPQINICRNMRLIQSA